MRKKSPDIPNVSEDMLKELDEEGIIRVGASVKSSDILRKTDAEEELISLGRSSDAPCYFGEKLKEVRDASPRVLTVKPVSS